MSFKRKIISRLNPLTRWRLEQLDNMRARLWRISPQSFECSLCNYQGYFGPAGWPVRAEAQCPRCKSLERHRLLGLWLNANPQRIAGRRVLHFAPEPAVVNLLKPLASAYQTADIAPDKGDIILDIERIALPDQSFDVVVCSHVLEHVDDAAALPEIYRILAPGGFAVLMLPVIEGWAHTYENKFAVTVEDRWRHFGRPDHIRYYSADVRQRMTAVGFRLEEFTAEGELAARYALQRGEKVFVASKP